jgi:aldehyde dehydrogenase (NAD+)
MLDKKRISFPSKLFINGEFVDSEEGATLEVVNPHDNTKLVDLAEGRAGDIDKAVSAAHAAFPAWAAMPAAERGHLLLKLADKLQENFDEFAELESIDTGHPIRDTKFLDVPRTIANFRFFGGIADKIDGRQVPVDPGLLNYVKREPIGVVGQIVPWNFPLMFCSWKLGPALAAGNCVVMKPSELVPMTTLRLAEVMNDIGFPAGVVNIVPGYGHTAGQHLAEHPDVQKIAFTGSTATGKKIVLASAGNLKKVQLELGGKGANIVFDDADMTSAVNGSAFAIFHNQGQACIAGSRLLLQETIAEEFLEKFTALAATIRLGDPLDPETEMGPLTSKLHQERVLNYCAVVQEEGGEILLGGKVPTGQSDLAKGCYLEPTIVKANAGDRVFYEEVFGPFVSITTFKDEADAIRLANDSDYGLGGGLWTNNLQRAHRVAHAVRAGMVWVNTYKRVSPGSPFGGVGGSGYGRDLGIESMYEYTDAKSIWINYGAPVHAYYKR